MSLKTFLAKIGAWFKGIFNAADKAIQKLSPELKAAFEKGSGIVYIINSLADKAPDFVYAAIEDAFPNLTKDDIIKAMQTATTGLNIGSDIADSSNVLELVTTVQTYLSKLRGFDGSKWAKTSSFLAKLIAQLYAPEGTKSSIFELLMEVFFQKYIKKAA